MPDPRPCEVQPYHQSSEDTRSRLRDLMVASQAHKVFPKAIEVGRSGRHPSGLRRTELWPTEAKSSRASAGPKWEVVELPNSLKKLLGIHVLSSLGLEIPSIANTRIGHGLRQRGWDLGSTADRHLCAGARLFVSSFPFVVASGESLHEVSRIALALHLLPFPRGIARQALPFCSSDMVSSQIHYCSHSCKASPVLAAATSAIRGRTLWGLSVRFRQGFPAIDAASSRVSFPVSTRVWPHRIP
ncbi:hypothetical protein R1flu_026709 [Riccia fluitans]|uniref:Uncharacterized protein n=1 Tax=Riccia fluitans TaxID=41844 RepID=A0ABD1XGR7_9MARC